MTKLISLSAPAKINLTLDVKGRRPDGYHELETVMHQISLADNITIRAIPRGIELTCDHPDLPVDDSNLAYRAAWEILKRCSAGEGVAIDVKKHIPIGAGLAGGSTDAAAVLIGINRLYNYGIITEQLQDWGALIGSDVPFCIKGGTALARGRGEILEKLPPGPPLNLVLVKPDFSVSTAEVYRQYSLQQPKKTPDTRAFLEAWRRCDMIRMCTAMENVLESVTAARFADIEQLKTRMQGLGAAKSLMSGSGPTVFGIFEETETARSAWESLQKDYQEAFLVSSYNGGENIGREAPVTS